MRDIHLRGMSIRIRKTLCDGARHYLFALLAGAEPYDDGIRRGRDIDSLPTTIRIAPVG